MNNEALGYRASIGALIVNNKKEFLLGKLVGIQDNEHDFIKGGMHGDEEDQQTLARELQEELGDAFMYTVLEESHWYVMYNWSKELQVKKGFRGQARKSYWVYYDGGAIHLDAEELESYRWVPETELLDVMLESHYPEFLTKVLLHEWEDIKKKHADLWE